MNLNKMKGSWRIKVSQSLLKYIEIEFTLGVLTNHTMVSN